MFFLEICVHLVVRLLLLASSGMNRASCSVWSCCEETPFCPRPSYFSSAPETQTSRSHDMNMLFCQQFLHHKLLLTISNKCVFHCLIYTFNPQREYKMDTNTASSWRCCTAALSTTTSPYWSASKHSILVLSFFPPSNLIINKPHCFK